MPPVFTLSVLGEKIGKIETGIEQIKSDVKGFNEQGLNIRVTKLEDTVKWLSRALGGALISGVGAILVAVVSR